jgi:hypothetical protein
VVFTADKVKYIVEQGVAVLFEDYDENFLELPESVCVCKVRERENQLRDEARTGERQV